MSDDANPNRLKAKLLAGLAFCVAVATAVWNWNAGPSSAGTLVRLAPAGVALVLLLGAAFYGKRAGGREGPAWFRQLSPGGRMAIAIAFLLVVAAVAVSLPEKF